MRYLHELADPDRQVKEWRRIHAKRHADQIRMDGSARRDKMSVVPCFFNAVPDPEPDESAEDNDAEGRMRMSMKHEVVIKFEPRDDTQANEIIALVEELSKHFNLPLTEAGSYVEDSEVAAPLLRDESAGDDDAGGEC
jgi:hypothetical protein